MKIFKNLNANVLEYVTNDLLIEQYEKKPELYEIVVDESKKADKKPTLNDLKTKADELGIAYNKKVTKSEILDLINNKENEK